MKMEILESSKTKDKKDDRVIISMTGKESSKILHDISKDARSKSIPLWHLFRLLSDYHQGKMILEPQESSPTYLKE